jgi:hypothetical protein
MHLFATLNPDTAREGDKGAYFDTTTELQGDGRSATPARSRVAANA